MRRGKFVTSKLSGNYINVFRSEHDNKIITVDNMSQKNIKVARGNKDTIIENKEEQDNLSVT